MFLPLIGAYIHCVIIVLSLKLFLIVERFLFIHQVAHMVEEHEEVMEQWWFNEYSASEDADLHQYLCIDNIKGIYLQGAKYTPARGIMPFCRFHLPWSP